MVRNLAGCSFGEGTDWWRMVFSDRLAGSKRCGAPGEPSCVEGELRTACSVPKVMAERRPMLKGGDGEELKHWSTDSSKLCTAHVFWMLRTADPAFHIGNLLECLFGEAFDRE